ncbi:MAG: DUF2961 domain-containing protein, partial [Candidatus Aminicenantes bacterium]|nr:DUF2961 domain-containing protein [Candidatus Aminicenantes bacterium]
MKKWVERSILLLAAAVLTLQPGWSQEMDSLAEKMKGGSRRVSSGKILLNGDAVPLEPGETKILAALKGPGKITHIWMTIFSEDLRYPRSVVLRMYWDGAKVPSVETPIGDFFGCGNGMKADVNSLPVKVSSYGRAYNCYWVMPFAKEAVITITNESGKRTPACYYQIDWRKLDEVPDNLMYFHARYHQEYPVKVGEPYTV